MRAAIVDPRVQPVVNLVTEPRPKDAASAWGTGGYGTGGAGTIAPVDGAGPHGETACRITWTAAPTGGGCEIRTGIGGAVTWAPGDLVTVSIYVRASVPFAVFPGIRQKAGATNVLASSTAVILVPNTWTRLAVTVTGALDWTAGDVIARTNQVTSGPAAVGSWFEATCAMATRGSQLRPYIDGDRPGARWLGTPGASQSVGYPGSL